MAWSGGRASGWRSLATERKNRVNPFTEEAAHMHGEKVESSSFLLKGSSVK